MHDKTTIFVINANLEKRVRVSQDILSKLSMLGKQFVFFCEYSFKTKAMRNSINDIMVVEGFVNELKTCRGYRGQIPWAFRIILI